MVADEMDIGVWNVVQFSTASFDLCGLGWVLGGFGLGYRQVCDSAEDRSSSALLAQQMAQAVDFKLPIGLPSPPGRARACYGLANSPNAACLKAFLPVRTGQWYTPCATLGCRCLRSAVELAVRTLALQHNRDHLGVNFYPSLPRRVVVQLAELGIEEVQIEKVTSIRQSRDGSFVTDDDSDISSVSEGEPPDDPSVGSDLFEKVSRSAALRPVPFVSLACMKNDRSSS